MKTKVPEKVKSKRRKPTIKKDNPKEPLDILSLAGRITYLEKVVGEMLLCIQKLNTCKNLKEAKDLFDHLKVIPINPKTRSLL